MEQNKLFYNVCNDLWPLQRPLEMSFLMNGALKEGNN